MTLVSLAILAFVAVQLGIGVWASRRVATGDDYLVAGRRLGVGLAGFSIFATWFAAESIMGASASIAADGLSGGRADPLGYGVCLLLLGLFFAARMRRTGGATLAEVFRTRYGAGAERLAALVMIPTSLIWGAAQIKAFGHVLAFETPLAVDGAIIVAATLVITYTLLGGLLGDVITDAVQGAIVLVGVLAMAVALVMRFGGPSEAAAVIEPSQLALVPPGESIWTRLDTWLVPVIGALIVQETASRVLACRTPAVARNAALMGGGMYLVFGAVPVVIGLLGAHLGLDLSEEAQDSFIPVAARELLHPVAYVVFVGALVSAMLSTVDSTILAIGALVSNDLLPARMMTQRRRLLAARVVVVLSGVACCLIALRGTSILDLVMQSDSFGTAGIAVVGVMGLLTGFGGLWAAVATLAVGLASAIVFNYLLPIDAPFMASLACSAATFLAVGRAERRLSARRSG
ncbi:MAG: hypothetical protein KJZ54_10520 [Phycisphaerales bacterium]|nr:hypothetical protein [Phycisphaerales bacterium]